MPPDPRLDWCSALERYGWKCRQKAPASIPMFPEGHPDCFRIQLQKMAWSSLLSQALPDALAQRSMFALLRSWSTDPLLLLETDELGLMALDELLVRDRERDPPVILLLEEWRSWKRRREDREWDWHVHASAVIRAELTEEEASRARTEHPVSARHQYWLHCTALDWGPQQGSGQVHLWAWAEGEEPEHLDGDWESWVH